MRQLFLFISLGVLGFGIYLWQFYDVPDSQIMVNFYVSRFLAIAGAASILMNLFWSSPKKRKREE